MPCRPVRYLLAAALAAACHGVLAQQMSTAVPSSATVQQLAPQLVLFAGSQQNFDSLVNGLAQGAPIRLTTVLPDGSTQVVTFTPSGTLTPLQIAQVLEAARQQLIGLGIANPTAEQIGVALVGGRVPTPLGGTQVAGVIPSAAAQAQANAAAGATALPAGTNAVNVQVVPSPPVNTTATTTTTGTLATPAPRVNTSDSPTPAGATSRTPTPGNVSNSPTPSAPTPAPSTPSTMRR